MRKFSMCTTQSLRYRGTFVALLLLLATCLSAQVTWTGGINVFWNTNGNWSSGTVPTLSDEVIIPAGATNMPFVPNFYIANFATLEIQSGATIGFGFRCTMAGTGGITNYGTLAMVNSTVTCASDIENYNLFKGSNFFLDQVIGAPMPTFTNKTGAVMNLNSGGNRTFKFGIINESGTRQNKMYSRPFLTLKTNWVE